MANAEASAHTCVEFNSIHLKLTELTNTRKVI